MRAPRLKIAQAADGQAELGTSGSCRWTMLPGQLIVIPSTLPLMAKITILPANVSAEVPDGENLIEAGEKAGVEMEAGCFNCSCGTCVAEVVSGMENLTEPTPEELDVLDQWNKDPDKFRLTCCNKVLRGEVVLRAGH